MTLVPYRNLGFFDDISKDINKLFSKNLLANLEADAGQGGWAPAVDIIEEAERFVVKADVPGVNPKEIDITIDNGVLTLRGERRSEQMEDKNGVHRVERMYGSFQRQFSLPDSVDVDAIKASGNNGVLEIELPKKEKVKPKKVAIN